ncbi:GrpB family protein [Vibrio diabolicus]|uniref:GrpB family protein n=1 Tax=Vibrio diabolicus TaxID=50719 RepID=UPI00062BFEAF|nr:GrpB family protein [Vibrio diabolicus]
MKLGLANHKVDVVKHEAAWRQEFARCRSELALVTEITPTRIEHIGSTAILDMPAKPILDMVLGIEHFPHVSLKLSLVEQAEITIEKYTDAKANFVRKVINELKTK